MSLVIEFRTKADLLDYDRAYSTKSEHLGNHDKDISWKLALESENHRLTELLNEERKALYDEEIVRQLATRYAIISVVVKGVPLLSFYPLLSIVS